VADEVLQILAEQNSIDYIAVKAISEIETKDEADRFRQEYNNEQQLFKAFHYVYFWFKDHQYMNNIITREQYEDELGEKDKIWNLI
jgi:hypothetical protein